MKKINIQRDLESRRNMVQAVVPAVKIETVVEPIKAEEYAESEDVPGTAPDAGAPAGEKPKKRKRATEGDVPALPV
jgi:hypothetical protein